MKYVAAYLLANLGGNAQPSAKDIENILGAGGLDVDMENVNTVINALKGKSMEEVIAAGSKKLASVPSGAPSAAAAPAAAAAAPAAEEKKEAKKEEKKEESEDEDMGFGLFD